MTMTDQEYDELDLAVARAEIAAGQFVEISDAGRPTVRDADGLCQPFRPSVNWSHAGPIIERERIQLGAFASGQWAASIRHLASAVGDTPLIAAMRVYLMAKSGDQ